MIDRNTPLCGVQGKDSGWLSFCTAVLVQSLAEDRVEWSVCEKWGWNCVLTSLAFNGGAYICIWGGNFCAEKSIFYDTILFIENNFLWCDSYLGICNWIVYI